MNETAIFALNGTDKLGLLIKLYNPNIYYWKRNLLTGKLSIFTNSAF